MKYCPVIETELSFSVIAVGQVGVWRIVHLDAFSNNERVHSDIREQDPDQPFQPESHLIEISKGTYNYV